MQNSEEETALMKPGREKFHNKRLTLFKLVLVCNDLIVACPHKVRCIKTLQLRRVLSGVLSFIWTFSYLTHCHCCQILKTVQI